MNSAALRITALATAVAFGTVSCESLTPGQNAAAFGGGSAILAGSIARAAGLSTGESIAVGAAVGAAAALTAYVISKHQASERQKRIAEERARAAAARLAAERHHTQKRVAQGTKAGGSKPLPRYIAVDTVKDQNSSPKAQRSVMIYDTQSQEIVGNNVYDLGKTPSVGSTAKIDNYSTEYVGSGH